MTLCGREGNRRSGTALAMRYGLRWSNHLRGLKAYGLDMSTYYIAYVPIEYVPFKFGTVAREVISSLRPFLLLLHITCVHRPWTQVSKMTRVAVLILVRRPIVTDRVNTGTRPVNTDVKKWHPCSRTVLDTLHGDQHGPWTWASFWTPVFTGREHEPSTRVVCTQLYLYDWKWTNSTCHVVVCQCVASWSIVQHHLDFTCDPKSGTFATVQMLIDHDVDVVFGPMCSGGTRN